MTSSRSWSLTTQLEQSQTRIANLREALDSEQECNANLREALDSEQEQRRVAQNSLTAVRKDINAKDRRIQALLDINSALTKEKDTLDILLVKAGQQQDEQVAEIKAQLDAAEAEHEKERDEHAKSIQDLKSKLTLRNEILTTQLEQAKKDQEGQASRDAGLISQRESYIAEITAKLNAKEEEHQRTMDEREQHIRSLYKEKADQSELVAELQRDVERVETLESEIKRLRTVNETLEGVIHRNSKDYAEALKNQLGCTREEFERVRECLRKQKEVQQAQLNMKQAQSQLMMAMTDVKYSAQKLIKDGHPEASI